MTVRWRAWPLLLPVLLGAACKAAEVATPPPGPGVVKVPASQFPLEPVRASAPPDAAATHLGRTIFPQCHRMVVGTVVASTQGAAGTDILKIREDEVVWGDPDPELVPYTVLCGEHGLAPGPGGHALFLLRLLPGGGYGSLEVAPLDDAAGPARLQTFRTYLAVEQIADPPARRAALLRYLREAVRAEDAWVRANAIREYAAFVDAFPDGLAPEDGAALARVLPSLRDASLKRLAQAALDRAPSSARTKPGGSTGPGGAGSAAAAAAALEPFTKRYDAARKASDRIAAVIDAAAKLDRGAAPLVQRALGDPDPAVRESGVAAAGETGMSDLGARILPLVVTDSSPVVRRTAILCLGHLRHGAAVDTLAGLAEGDPDLAREAMFALARIRDPAAIAKLQALREGGGDERRRLADFLLSDEFVQQERAMGARWTSGK